MLTPADCSFLESADSTVFHGEIDGNVTIRCPVNKQNEVIFLYLQRDEIFVNGFHSVRNMSEHPAWKNTRVDRKETTVSIYGLNVSHNGSYACCIGYIDKQIETKTVDLIVTGMFNIKHHFVCLLCD